MNSYRTNIERALAETSGIIVAVQSVVFGKYTLLRRLTIGGMAELYLARSADNFGVERVAVLKVIAARFAKDPAFARMFQDEARIAATLNHPNIGQVFDVGEVMGRQYLAMEFLHGQDLREIVRRLSSLGQGGLPLAIAVHVGCGICAALEFAHNARGIDGTPLGIIHRDVSPSNIMVRYDGHVKLLDFGIAKAKNRSALTEPGTIKGKVRYLSPQQLMGEGIDHRSDIFTLGISLWEATVGRHLFEGEQDIQVYEAIHSGRIRPPSSVIADYPRDLEAIVLKALAYRAEDRYASAALMQHDLERYAIDNKLPLAESQTARFMRVLFEEELAAWQSAQSRGGGLLDYLLAGAPAEDLALNGLLEDEDVRPTNAPIVASGVTVTPEAPPKPAAATASPTAAGPAAATGPAAGGGAVGGAGAGGERRTVMFGEHYAPLAPPVMEKPRGSTSGHVSLGRGDSNAKKRRRPSTGSHVQVSEHAAVELRRDGSVQIFAGNASGDDEESGRRTVLHDLLGQPTIAPDREPLVAENAVALGEARRLAQQQERQQNPMRPDLDEHGRPRRPQTGDWSHQNSSNERRPGTHPFFKRADDAPEAFDNPYSSTDSARRPKSRRPLWIGLGIAAVALCVGSALLLLHSTGAPPAASQPSAPPPKPVDTKAGTAAASSQPAATSAAATSAAATGQAAGATSQGATTSAPASGPDAQTPATKGQVSIASSPPGAAVYRARDGLELGKTPLALAAKQVSGEKLELHLSGHHSKKVVFAPGAERLAVSLEPLSATPTVAPKALGTNKPRKKRHPRRRKRTGTKKRPSKSDRELKNPF